MDKLKHTFLIWTKQPVVKFLLIGLLLFLADRFIIQANSIKDKDEFNIYITKGDIIALEETWKSKFGRPPTEKEVQGLINQRVEEDIFYREAKKIGLDKNDDVIRERLAEKLKFLTSNTINSDSITSTEIEEYFERNMEKYIIPENITFIQLFVNPPNNSSIAQEVSSRLAELNRIDINSPVISRYGDPFSLRSSFSYKTREELAAAFGREFMNRVFDLETDKWYGPVMSGYGEHLVYVTHKSPTIVPELETVKKMVIVDLHHEKQDKLNNEYIDGIMSRYEIIIER